MSTDPEREAIPAGKQPRSYRHLYPIAQLLIERGHYPIRNKDKFGFCPTPGGVVCRLTRRFTEDDWTAINDRFLIPDNIVWFNGLIRDTANWVDMHGVESLNRSGESVPIEEWEEEQRRAGKL